MTIACAQCNKENCDKPSGWHIIYWVQNRTKEGLERTIDKEPSLHEAAINDPEMLSALCKELGWQGGTIRQVKNEILRLSSLDTPLPEVTE